MPDLIHIFFSVRLDRLWAAGHTLGFIFEYRKNIKYSVSVFSSFHPPLHVHTHPFINPSILPSVHSFIYSLNSLHFFVFLFFVLFMPHFSLLQLFFFFFFCSADATVGHNMSSTSWQPSPDMIEMLQKHSLPTRHLFPFLSFAPSPNCPLWSHSGSIMLSSTWSPLF